MADVWGGLIETLERLWFDNKGLIELLLIILVLFIILSIILALVKKYLTNKVKSKKQISNVTLFIDLLKYFFVFLAVIVILLYYTDKIGELGFLAGLLTVALGWALQKPISGLVAWLIIITRRPFSIGDRVIISDIKGDISNITLTHIFLDEVGGTIMGEETSRRVVMIPNSILFEREVINYTSNDEYILDEIKMSVTYESDIEKAERIMKNCVRIVMRDFWDKFSKRVSKESNTRLEFKDSGVEVSVRFNTIATSRNQISTDIRREIHRMVTVAKEVEFAYPHSEVLFREK